MLSLRTKKIHATSRGEKIKQPLGEKNHSTSQDKKKSCNIPGQKNSRYLLGQKKSRNLFEQIKIMQSLGTKQNHATSWDKINHTTFWDKKLPQPHGTKKSRKL